MSNKIIVKTSGKSDKLATFKIEKDFSIYNIEQVKNELDDIIEKYPSFHLNLKNMDNFDLSSIQLLHSLKNKLGDEFNYTIDVKDEIKTIIKHSGFEYLLNK